MVQIYNEPSFGKVLGTGIAQSLNALAQNKMQQVQQRNQQRQTQKFLETALPGRKAEEYAALAGGDPKLLQQFIKGESARPGEEAYANAINQLMGGESGSSISEKGRLNAQQATNLANLSFKQQEAKERNQLAKQKHIDAINKTYNDPLDKSLLNAEAMREKALQLIAYAETGNVASGLEGALRPQWTLNNESREFDAIGDQLATLAAGQKGVPTNFKIKWEKGSKPSLTHSTESQINLAKKVVEQADKVLKRGDIRNKLIAANQGNQPQNLGSLVEKKYKEMESGYSRFFETLDDTIKELIDNNDPIGTPVEDDEGNILYWNGQELVEENPNGI